MGTTPTLEAPIRNRARWRWNGWAAAMTAALAASTTLLVGRLAPPGRVIVMAPPAPELRPAIVVVPLARPEPTVTTAPPAPPAPPAATALGPCPATGRADEQPVGTTAVDDELLRQLDGETLVGAAAAATRHGALATWTEDTIFHSSDDGRSFAAVLHGPGTVRAVAIDCHGRVFALRALAPWDLDVELAAGVTIPMILGVRHGSHEAWRSVDVFADDRGGPRLAADGGVVAIAGAVIGGMDDGVLAVSSDAGATWRFDPLDVSGGWEGVAAMDVDRLGVVRVYSRWGDCRNSGSTLTRFDPEAGTSTSTEIATYPSGPAALDGDGRIYGRGWSCDGLCAWLGAGEGRAVSGWPTAEDDAAVEDDDDPGLELVGNGTTVYALLRGELYRLDGDRARWRARGLAMTRVLAVDAAGRVLGLTAGDDLVRWSPRYGLRYLAGKVVD